MMSFFENLKKLFRIKKSRALALEFKDENEPLKKVTSVQDYADLFENLSWVYAGIKKIATAVSSLYLKIYDISQEERIEVDKGPVVDIFYNPNPLLSYTDLFELTTIHLEIFGEAYWEIVKDELGIPIALYPLRPDRIKLIPDPKRYISGYIYSVNGEEIRLDVNDVVHFRYHSPLNEFEALAPLKALIAPAILDLYAVAYNQRFFKHGTKIPGILTIDSSITEEEFDRIKNKIMQFYSGVESAHKLLVLTGDVKYQEVGTRPKDFEFLSLRKMTREEILAVLGVPPALVGIFEYANYANSEVQRRMFWENTVIPIVRKISEAINHQLMPLFGDYEVEFDLSDVLKEDVKDIARSAQILVSQGIMTINEWRERQGLDPVPWGDIWWRPATLVPAEKETEKRLSKEEIWKEFDYEVSKIEREYVKALRKLFVKYKRRLLENFEKTKKEDFWQKFFEDLKDIQRKFLLFAIKRAFENMKKKLEFSETWQDVEPEIVEYLKQKYIKFAREVTETTRQRVTQALAEGLARGEGIMELMKRLDEVFEERLSDYELERIARTEIGSAYNYGLFHSAKRAKAKYKEWIATLDDRVRDSHLALHGTIVPIDEPFPNGLMYPKDPDGPPEEIINCRCTLTFHMEAGI